MGRWPTTSGTPSAWWKERSLEKTGDARHCRGVGSVGEGDPGPPPVGDHCPNCRGRAFSGFVLPMIPCGSLCVFVGPDGRRLRAAWMEPVSTLNWLFGRMQHLGNL